MSVVKINAIAVGEGKGEELEKRFAQRAGEVDNQPGFEGFELLRPVEGEDRYFIYTRWDSEESFQAWVNSQAFQHGHRQAPIPPPPKTRTTARWHTAQRYSGLRWS